MRKFWSCTFDPQLTYCVKILLRVWLMCIETYYQFVGRTIFIRFPSMQQLPKLPKWDLESFYIYFSFKIELSRAFSATQRDGVLRVTLKKDASKILSKTISKFPMSRVKDVSKSVVLRFKNITVFQNFTGKNRVSYSFC